MTLPPITDEDRQWLHYNPNTSDIVEWVQAYAAAAVAAERDAIIDIVASHGGSVEIEAAIRARSAV